MKKIVLLDLAFPYEKTEAFLESEIKYYDSNTEIYIANCLLQDPSTLRECGSAKILKIAPVGPRFIRIIKMLYWDAIALTRRQFWQELGGLKASHRLSFHRTLTLFIFMAEGERCFSQIKRQLSKLPLDGELLFYSYWMHIHAYAAARLKALYPGSKWITRCHRYDLYEEHSPYGYIPLREYILSNADRIFCIAQDGADYLAGRYPHIKDKLTISRLGTEDHGIGQVPDKKEFVLISCSWVVEVKRVHLIAEALSRITDIPIRWIHFGNGLLFEKLKEKAKTLPPNIKTEFPGAVSNTEIHSYYKNIGGHVLVNVSSSEGVPVSIMEAMSYGIPVIATDVGGVSEIMIEKEQWLLKSDFQIDELAQKIRKLYEMEDEEYMTLRNRVRNGWESMCDSERCYTAFVAELKKI